MSTTHSGVPGQATRNARINIPFHPSGSVVVLLLVAIGAFAAASNAAAAAAMRMFEAESAERIRGATRMVDRTASGGRLVGLGAAGQGVKFNRIPAASKLAIRYASVSAGTISVSIIAPKEAGAGKIEVHVDGAVRATADLSTPGARRAGQTVCNVAGLPAGEHTVAIVNRGPGPVAVDALIVR